MKRIVGIALLLVFFCAGHARAQLQPIPIQGSTSAEGSHVFAGTLFSGITINWQSATTARYFMLFDGTSLPSDGSTTSCTSQQKTGCLAYCAFAQTSTSAPSVFSIDWTLHPVMMRNGVVAAMSTGAGCGTLTVDSSNDFFYAQVR